MNRTAFQSYKKRENQHILPKIFSESTYRACEGKIYFPSHFYVIALGIFKGVRSLGLYYVFGGWFYTADTFYLKISLFYFTDIPTYKKTGITYSLH